MKLNKAQYHMLLHPLGEEQEALSRVYFAWKAGTGHDYMDGDADIAVVLKIAIDRLEPQKEQG